MSRRYIADFVAKRDRTAASAAFVGSSALGMAAGETLTSASCCEPKHYDSSANRDPTASAASASSQALGTAAEACAMTHLACPDSDIGDPASHWLCLMRMARLPLLLTLHARSQRKVRAQMVPLGRFQGRSFHSFPVRQWRSGTVSAAATILLRLNPSLLLAQARCLPRHSRASPQRSGTAPLASSPSTPSPWAPTA